MTVTVTLIYAGIIAVLMAVLSTLTAVKRGSTGVALGDGGNAGLALAIRRFGNLSEYAAMAVVMLLLMELAGVAPGWLHAYGIALVAVRLLHPFILFDSMEASSAMKVGRFAAGAGTAALLLVSGIVLVVISLG
ncbi:MAG: MAPEG family protein [Pseudomonadota bacterium]